MKNKTTMFLLAMFAGAIIGAAIVWMLCNCCCHKSCNVTQTPVPPPVESPGNQQINDSVANTYFKEYLKSPIHVDTLKAFTISFTQFNAMQQIANSDTSVHGFRIYLGMDGKTPVRMVVGTGSPDKVNKIILTDDVNSGPCPYICDDSSPIMDK
ncbi:MAG: hypothetical protein ACOYNC_02515 [Bacteroidales bacterium]